MTLLHLLSYAGAVSAFVFVTLSLASGLLWISELIEEHSRLAKIVGRRGIYVIILVHFLLYIYDSLPLKHILFSVFCHIVYLQNFTPSWPFISLTSLSFIGSCVLVVLDHFLWFFYFAQLTQEVRHRAHRSYRGPPLPHAVPNFGDITTFFGVCVWLAPLFLFLSLSANDNALPVNAGSQPSSPTKVSASRSRTSLFKALFDVLPVDSFPFSRMGPRMRRKDTSEGIIAPRSPSPQPPISPGFGPVPALNGMPSPLLVPRRVSSDIYRPGSPSNFSLGPPPRRSTDETPREGSGGSRLEMRRAASAQRTSTTSSSDGWREF
ncbi:transmembrane adaptor Erv26-domain-containing protein [Fomes fomentarius]|nr:transmembrane adaptor Erv26-domain-containing protein [Fomes fomentarius]